MIEKIKNITYKLLRKSEKYTKTDMTYLAKGGSWLLAGQTISSLSALVLSIAFANLLPKDTFGVYKYILSVVGILSIASLTGIDTATAQAVARNYEGGFIKGVRYKIRWGFLGGIAGLLLSSYYYINANTTLSICMAVASLLFPLMNGFDLFSAFLSGKQKFKDYTLYNIITQIGSAVVLICTILLTNNLVSIVSAYFLSNTFFNYIFLRRTLQRHPPNNLEDGKSVSYAKHLSTMDLIATVSNQLDKILVFHFLGAADLATYTIAFAPTEQMKALLKNINALAMPKFAVKSDEDIRRNIKGKIYLFGLIISIGIFLYVILAPFLFNILFPRYAEAVIYSQVFAISVLGIMLSAFIQTIFQAKALTNNLYRSNIYGGLSNIILLIPFTYFFGLWGAVIAKTINRFFVLFLSLGMVKKI